MVPGVGTIGAGDAILDRAVFWGALRADLLLGRARTTDFGIGPYLLVGTAAFDDLRVATGVSCLLPLGEDFPVVFSLGALTRDANALGLDGSLFWGIRSYNFHGAYNLAGGVILGAQRTFGSQPDNLITLGIQVDAFVFSIPVLLARGALQ